MAVSKAKSMMAKGLFWLQGQNSFIILAALSVSAGQAMRWQLSVIWRKLKRLVACLPLNKTLQSSTARQRDRENKYWKTETKNCGNGGQVLAMRIAGQVLRTLHKTLNSDFDVLLLWLKKMSISLWGWFSTNRREHYYVELEGVIVSLYVAVQLSCVNKCLCLLMRDVSYTGRPLLAKFASKWQMWCMWSEALGTGCVLARGKDQWIRVSHHLMKMMLSQHDCAV